MSKEGLREFFQTIWKTTPGFVCIAALDKDRQMKRMMFPWPSAQESVIDHVLAKNGTGYEVFYSPALFHSNKNAQKTNVKGAWVCWADFDGNAPPTWDTRLAPANLAPSLRVRTSGPSNQHCYWAQTEFISEIDELEGKNRQLAYQLKADTSGWDANQLLRPPYTTNHGYSKPERKKQYDVSIEEASSRTFQPDFIELVDDFRPVVKESLAPAQIPTIGEALAKGRWPDKFFETFFNPTCTVPVGQRSDAYMAFAYIAAEAGLDDGGIYSIIADLDSRWQLYFHRSDKERRYVDFIERARRKIPRGQNSAFAKLFQSHGEDPPKIVYSYRDFMDTTVLMEWVYKDLLTVNGYGILAGDPGVGKTSLALRLAISLSTGADFLTWTNTSKKSRKVLFLSLEMVHAGLQLFLQHTETTRTPEENELIEKNLMLSPIAATLPLDTKDGREFLQSLLDDYKPDIVIIDSLSKATYKSLADEAAAKEFNDYIVRLRKQHEVTVLFIHHSRKVQDAKNKTARMDALYGSRFLSAEVDFLLTFFKTASKGFIGVESTKIRYGPEPEDFVIERGRDLSFQVCDFEGARAFTEKIFSDSNKNSARARGPVESRTSFGLGFTNSD